MRRPIITIIPVAATLVMICLAVIWDLYQSEFIEMRAEESEHVKLGVELLRGTTQAATQNLLELAEDPDITRVMQSAGQPATIPIEQHLLRLASINRQYEQLRWIDATGMELVRIKVLKDQPVVIPRNELLDQSKKYCFRESMKLKPGQIYISSINHITEHDAAENTYKPVIRFFIRLPASKDGRDNGVLGINCYMSAYFDQVGRTLKKEHINHFMLLNSAGYPLMPQVSGNAPSFTTDQSTTLVKKHPQAWERIATEYNGSLLSSSGYFAWETYDPGESTPMGIFSAGPFKLVSFVTREEFLDRLMARSMSVVSVTLLALLLLVIGVFRIGRLQQDKDKLKTMLMLQDSEARFEHFMKYNPAIAWILDQHGTCTYVNHTFQKNFGVNLKDIQHGGDNLAWLQNTLFSSTENAFTDLIASNGSESESYVSHPDGTRSVWRIFRFAIKDVHGNNLICGLGTDITRTRQDEEKLLSQKMRLDNILSGTNAGTWEWNIQTGEVMFNERWAEIIGYTLEELSPVSINTWLEHAHPDDLKQSGLLLEKHFAGELHYYDCETRIRHRDGHWVWVRDCGRVASWASDGRPLWMYGTHTDISYLKYVETALRENEQRLSDLVHVSTDWLWEINRSGVFTYVGPRTLDLFGYTSEEILGKSPLDLMPATEAERMAAELAGIVHSQRAFRSLATIYLHKNGHEVILEISGCPIFGHDDELCGYRGVGCNVTDRVNAEKEIRDLNENLITLVNERTQEISTLLESAPIAIVKTVAGRIHRYNKYFIELFGFAADEPIVNRETGELFAGSPLARYVVDANCPELRAGRFCQAEGQLVRRDGTTLWVLLVGKLLAADDIAKGALWTLTDITERRQNEERLRLSQKLDAVGMLAGGIAHDINNKLTVILGYTELLKKQGYTSDNKLAEIVDEIRLAGLISKSTINRLLAFARSNSVSPQCLIINDALVESVKASTVLISDRIKIETDLDHDLWHVFLDPVQFDLILTNLILNARDAMPDGGLIEITTRNEHLDADLGEVPTGDYVVLTCRDTGCGMSLEVQQQIFTPFFSTKEVGVGTGLGLSSVHGIMKQNLGHITVKSSPEAGSTFTLYFQRSITC